ncbi:MAG: phosphate acyltransferase PlsX [Clostridia bacterium]|nr:phosphate acyltransferase PlsX [Clostridia bacterium]
MENGYKIAIDVMGSDNGPAALVEGAVKALETHKELSVVLFGDGSIIEERLTALSADRTRVEVVATTETITNYDNPMEAIFGKMDSSLVRALTALGEREDLIGLINAGNTGALLAGALRYVPAKELKRPALAAILPAEKGGFTCLVDTGANIDCNASMLVAFAHMGSDFMKENYGLAEPRVGLLSNGAEETKGNKLVKETHALLKQEKGLNFIGNIEGNNALSGDCDVLVADGFAGNQVFKSAEGIARRLITDIVKYAKTTGSKEIMGLVGHLMGIYDFSALGGGIVLGAGKPIIKARGSAKPEAVVNTAAMLLNMAKNRDVFYGKDER